ncbi:hypothetical protein Dsin_029046 [Dipteronia sinensis]|uniref:DUF4283 domain-containing protein n=1 Tax=Dipteronia sinensis TaxID=43782 RepID=A0AAD9ZSD7_9ROSI|nr:hypothetical protein Dsin_029046 [Dipteronia sinensis]
MARGYYVIHFSLEEDIRRIWASGTYTLTSGVFRLFQWKPDFNPYGLEIQTHAHVWIRIYCLCWEYLEIKEGESSSKEIFNGIANDSKQHDGAGDVTENTPIRKRQFLVTTGTFNALMEDRDLMESFSLIQIQMANNFFSIDLNTKYLNLEDNNENPQCSLKNICIINMVILDNPQQDLDRISRDQTGKINLEKISKDQDIHASNSNHGPVDPMFDNNWIPVVIKSKRKVKPTFKILSSSKSQMSNESSKRLPVAEAKIRHDSTASPVQAELRLVVNWAAQVEAEGNDSGSG